MKETMGLVTIFLSLLFISTAFAAVPPTPTNIKISAISTTELNITWNSVSAATNYTLYRATRLTGSYSRITTTEDTFYLDDDLDPDTTYFYEIKSANASGSSSASDPVNATTLSEASKVVDTLRAVPSAKKIVLFWELASNARYTVYRSSSRSGTYAIIAQDLSYDSYLDSDLQPNTTYFYKLGVRSSSGLSPLSNAVEVKTLEAQIETVSPIIVQPPINLTKVIQTIVQNATNTTIENNTTNITFAEDLVEKETDSIEETPSTSNTALYFSFGALFLIVAVMLAVLKFAHKKTSVPISKTYMDPRMMQVKEYVIENMRRGYTKNQIGTVMMQHGYSKQIIDEVMKYV